MGGLGTDNKGVVSAWAVDRRVTGSGGNMPARGARASS